MKNIKKRKIKYASIITLFQHIFQHVRKVLISLMYAEMFGRLIGRVKHAENG